ncbi:hypothetical protein JCM8097_004153 [Rhodosporidiobolus ruineniae]
MTAETDRTNKPCWVCGQTSSERCSSCAKAGLDIFFCSRECQKLVWPAHRVFCGPDTANPFLLPGLSLSEAKEAKAHLSDEFLDTLNYGTAGSTLSLEKVMESFGVRKEQLAALLDLYVVKPGTSAAFKPATIQFHLALIRLVELQRSMAAATPAFYTIIQISKMIVMDLRSIYQHFERSPPTLPWLAPLLHRASIHFFLVATGFRIPQLRNEALERCTYSALRAVIQDEVKPTHPVEAKRLQDNLELGRHHREVIKQMPEFVGLSR